MKPTVLPSPLSLDGRGGSGTTSAILGTYLTCTRLSADLRMLWESVDASSIVDHPQLDEISPIVPSRNWNKNVWISEHQGVFSFFILKVRRAFRSQLLLLGEMGSQLREAIRRRGTSSLTGASLRIARSWVRSWAWRPRGQFSAWGSRTFARNLGPC